MESLRKSKTNTFIKLENKSCRSMSNFAYFLLFSGVQTKSKMLKTIPNLCQLLFKQFKKRWILFWFFTEILFLLFPVLHWASANTDLPSNSNISKTVRVKIAFTKKPSLKTSFIIKCRLIDFVLAVLQLLMFKVYRNTGISKINFFDAFSTERVKTIENVKPVQMYK